MCTEARGGAGGHKLRHVESGATANANDGFCLNCARQFCCGIDVGQLWFALQAIKNLRVETCAGENFLGALGNSESGQHWISDDENGGTLPCVLRNLNAKLGKFSSSEYDFRGSRKRKGLHAVIPTGELQLRISA